MDNAVDTTEDWSGLVWLFDTGKERIIFIILGGRASFNKPPCLQFIIKGYYKNAGPSSVTDLLAG